MVREDDGGEGAPDGHGLARALDGGRFGVLIEDLPGQGAGVFRGRAFGPRKQDFAAMVDGEGG